ncbi:MAG: hypothetical protein H6669_02285 [Ardenticatenaceae bacterium]|nr:hypothetical protein [Ardenticatenaceae bacterium]
MLALKLDATSSLNVRWPRTYRAVVQLGETYTAYESSLATESQLQDVPLALIQAALSEAQTAIAAAQSGESGRAAAGEVVRQTYETVRPLLDKAIMRLKANHFDNLAQLEQWGLDTAVVKGKVSVRKPTSQGQWLDFLQAYVTKEASLSAEQQISDPPLATMQSHLDTMQASLTDRASGKDQREINIQARNTAVDRLLTLLKLAAAIRVVITYGGAITNDLQLWGFEVNGRVAGSKEEPIPPIE